MEPAAGDLIRKEAFGNIGEFVTGTKIIFFSELICDHTGKEHPNNNKRQATVVSFIKD
jgi:hypothetical protein